MEHFELSITKKDLKAMRRMLADSDVPDALTMPDTEVIQTAAFYMEFGQYGELDLRNRVRIKKVLHLRGLQG